MADGVTQIADIVVPEIFTGYVQQMTEQKSRLVQSGAVARNALMDQLLAGGGLTFTIADGATDFVVGDQFTITVALLVLDSTPHKIGSATEIAVRLSRNNSWTSSDLAAALAGEDPMDAIASRVAAYWIRRLQAAFIATWQGVSKDNGANDSGDYANDIVGASFVDGVTNFSAEAYLDAKVTMGDSMEDLSLVMVHSVVYNRMQKNNLIDFIPDARGETQIATFLGAEVIVDDNMPSGTSTVRGDGTAGPAGSYETWLFGAGATQFGVGSAKVPTEVERQASAGNGGHCFW